MKGLRRALFLSFLLAAALSPALAGTIEGPQGTAGEAPVAPLPNLPIDSIRAPAVNSVPYPNGTLYINHGISGTFMGGKRRILGENNLFQWQGDLSYYYTPWFSGGLAFRIIAGEPNSTKQKIINRYFAQARFHKAWKQVAIYAGPQIGVGNINILTDSTIRKRLDPTNTKPTLSLDMGGGWKFSRYFGFTLGSNMEYSLVDEEDVGTTNALNLHVSPGISLDIIPLTETLKELVPAFYFYGEFQSGFLISQKSGQRQDQAYVMGIGLAF
jgi:hypothetical protein